MSTLQYQIYKSWKVYFLFSGNNKMSKNNIGCIYLITNTENKKQYVGRTTHPTPQYRYYQHWHNSRHGSQTPLHRSMRKYGEKAFTIEILTITTIDRLNAMEIYWAEQLETYVWDTPMFHPPGYNATWCGDLNNIEYQRNNSFFAYKYKTPEEIKEFNALRKNVWLGRKHTPEACAKISKARKGHVQTEEHKRKGAAARTGKPLTASHIQNARNKRMESVIKNGGKGIKLTKDNILEIVKLVNDGISQTVVAEKFNVMISVISRIMSGDRWADITGIPKRETKKRGHSNLGMEQAMIIRNRYSTGKESYDKLAEEYKVSRSTIAYIIKNKLYKLNNTSE